MTQTIYPWSKKQQQLLGWWHPDALTNQFSGIIADGSIRAGKTFPMSISFIYWAFYYYDEQNFALCGKTVGSLKRNVIQWLIPFLERNGFHVKVKYSENLIVISKYGKTNRFYIFGGRDESSQDLIQGVTLAGVLLDEVALMPQSFVNQATGRCSVEGSKIWINCNPGAPGHWFKTDWLDDHVRKRLIHIHFTMPDNPSLSAATIARYETLYTGVFYKRFILGEWCAAEGLIYSMFTDECQYDTPYFPGDDKWDRSTHLTGIDVGTYNPTVFLHGLDDGDTIYINAEYYYDGRKIRVQKSDSQFADDYGRFLEEHQKPVVWSIIDPSASSFAAELQMRGYAVKKAKTKGKKDNFDKSAQDPHTVRAGIRMVASLFTRGKLKICPQRCPNLIRELGGYVWDIQAATERGEEKPIKQDDHALDALRYLVRTIMKEQPWRMAE